MSIQEVYSLLFDQIKKNPNNYVINKSICLRVKMLPVEYGEFLLGLIYNYYVIENKKLKVSELDLVKSIGKKSNILTVPYGGKTNDNGKAPNFNDISNKFPLALRQLIVAYVKYISDEQS